MNDTISTGVTSVKILTNRNVHSIYAVADQYRAFADQCRGFCGPVLNIHFGVAGLVQPTVITRPLMGEGFAFASDDLMAAIKLRVRDSVLHHLYYIDKWYGYVSAHEGRYRGIRRMTLTRSLGPRHDNFILKCHSNMNLYGVPSFTVDYDVSNFLVRDVHYDISHHHRIHVIRVRHRHLPKGRSLVNFRYLPIFGASFLSNLRRTWNVLVHATQFILGNSFSVNFVTPGHVGLTLFVIYFSIGF